ncbi:Holliday junction resolvase RuvX [Tissierella creatinini]|nr:Holliday junction resolvase RuvX [Tissierella creatinini]TJX69055.1 Holliday junction resolvase RuvX [Soehngenia saccharolytica]
MERFLGLDVGDKYIGVALSDLLQITAQGLTTIKRESKVKDFKVIEDLINEYQIKKIVVGLPKNMNGTMGPQSEKVIKFAEKIKNKFKIDIIYIDERLTTVSAERVLIESDVRRENRKKVIDKIAASYILQTYLDRKEL